MREKKTHLYLDGEERRLLLHSLVELKNQLIRQGVNHKAFEIISDGAGLILNSD